MFRFQSTLICVYLAFSFIPGLAIVHSQQSTISVTAVGATRIQPDRIQVRLSISNTEDGIIEARQVSDADAKKVLTAAQNHGVDESDFKVSDLSIAIGFSNELRRNLYTVTRDVSIDLNKMDKLNGLLADLLEIKNTKVRSINFQTSEEKKAEFKARQIAMEQAKEKAKQLAELAELKLGKAISIEVLSEQNTPFVTSVEPFVGSDKGGLFLQARAMGTQDSSPNSNQAPTIPSVVKPSSPVQIGKTVSATKNKIKAGSGHTRFSNQAFGLGEIKISIRLNVTFKMVEKDD